MKRILLMICLLIPATVASGQDFYDVDVLRTVDLTFHDSNWWNLLEQNYEPEINILADLTVEGVTYPDVGVRIRGNTSYTQLPQGSQKVSLNVEVDFVHEDQEVMGYRNLNFNNGHRDPTFCREVVYNNILARWIPSGRANHIVLTLNGDNWGVYANVQQYDKTMLREFFDDEDGLRIKCPNKVNGPGLQYMGTNPNSYGEYEIKDDGGLADPMAELIALCDAVDNTPYSDWETIDQMFAIDPSSWTVALENLYSDDDSYINKGADFVLYRNPADGRTHLHQTDGNETWTKETWSATFNFSSSRKPVLNNVLRSTEMRGRYFAHFRVAFEELDWTLLEAEFTARRNLIDAAVQADPKKLYTYQDFLDNFTSEVDLGGGGPGGGRVIGLQEYVTQRRDLLLSDPEVVAEGLTVQDVGASSNFPAPGDTVYITATVTGIDPVDSVYLYYQASTSGQYQRTLMADDGLSGDGAAGDDVFGALLPVAGAAGQRVHYYVGATAQNTYMVQTFSPHRTENDPLVLTFAGGPATGPVVINEFLAKNNSVIQDPAGNWEDYVELYNRGTATVDLSGMYMTDTFSEPTKWQIPAGVAIDPGQTLLIWADEELDEGPLHADFKLSADGEEIGFYDTDGQTLLDSVIFGPQLADISTGLLEDGGTMMVTFPVPTPDALNDPGSGVRAYDQLDPAAHTLTLDATGTGAIGTILTFQASNLKANGNVKFARGFDPDHRELAALVLLLQPSKVLTRSANSSGVMTLSVQVPQNPGLVGREVYFQVGGQDSSGSMNGSNAIHVTISD